MHSIINKQLMRIKEERREYNRIYSGSVNLCLRTLSKTSFEFYYLHNLPVVYRPYNVNTSSSVVFKTSLLLDYNKSPNVILSNKQGCGNECSHTL